MFCACGCGQETALARWTNNRTGATVGQRLRFVYGHNLRGRRNRFQPNGFKGCKVSIRPEWKAYHDAKQRCANPQHRRYADYGGRGIKFLFPSFLAFMVEIGSRPPGMTLDRIRNDGHYQYGNVRWATWKQQINNRRPQRRTTSV